MKRVNWIAPQAFANVLMEVLLPDNASIREVMRRHGNELVAMLTSRVNDPALAHTLESILATVETLSEVQTVLAAWYVNALRRFEPLYTRRNQLILLVISAMLALILNVDAIHVFNTVFSGGAVQQAVVDSAQAAIASGQLAQAAQAAQAPNPESTAEPEFNPGIDAASAQVVGSTTQQIVNALNQLTQQNQPFGWQFVPLHYDLSAPTLTCLAPDNSVVACDNDRNLWLFAPANSAEWLGLLVRKVIGIGLSVLILFFFANLGIGFTRPDRNPV